MGIRGRQSVASLAVVTPIADARPVPPDDLTDAQEKLFRAIVGRMPAKWFGKEIIPLLVAHVRHVSTADFLTEAIDAFEAEWLRAEGGVDRLDKLTKLRDREVRGATATARALRITKQSQVRAETAGRMVHNAGGGSKPWD